MKDLVSAVFIFGQQDGPANSVSHCSCSAASFAEAFLSRISTEGDMWERCNGQVVVCIGPRHLKSSNNQLHASSVR